MSRKSLILTLVLFVVFRPTNAYPEPLAKLYSARGSVEKQQSGSSDWISVQKGAEFESGDQIRTADGARAGLKFKGGKLVRLRENSQLKIEGPLQEKKGKMSILSGALYLFSRDSKDFPEVETPEVSASIRGTEVVVERVDGKTTINVLAGAVELKNSTGQLALSKGEAAEAYSGKPLKKRVLLDGVDSIQWAMWYPDLSSSLSSAQAHSSAGQKVMAAAEALTSGDVQSVGRIHSQLRTNSNLSSEILSAILTQEAILALTSNQLQQAEEAANQAAQLNPPSTAARIVQAAIEQARGNFEQAYQIIVNASGKGSSNPDLQAKLAELELGRGDSNRARSAALEALAVSPNHSAALSVLGFAELTGGDSQKASEYFQKAIDADPSAGMPHLGLGLSYINTGDLQAGREEFEKAVHLEPARGLFRSYLGKVFFEAQNENLAQEEYARAIELDSEDPTPYLYRAFTNLSQNRVVSALFDIEDSIARNNNRGVYRSRLMLDKDSAVRGATLAEVFNQLGFSEVSRVEAIKSINRDYSNYSAHRLLSESHDGFFFADASFREDVIADLFSPVSFNVFADQSGFSSAAGLNEYSALFERDQYRSGVDGSYEELGDQSNLNIYNTGKSGNFGHVVGYQRLYGKGSRTDGKYDRRQRVNLGLQYQIDPNNRLIGKGELIDGEYFLPGDELEQQEYQASLATHHRLSGSSEFVTQIEFLKRDFDTFMTEVSREVDQTLELETGATTSFDQILSVDEFTDEKTTLWRGDAQFVYNSADWSFVTGAGVLDSDGDNREDSIILADSKGYLSGLDTALVSSADYDTQAYLAYGYATYHAGDLADLSLGVSYRDMELPAFDVAAPYINGKRSLDSFSPKVGLSIYPTENLTVRASYFESLGISNLNDIGGLEPTLVGGINQVFNDLPGAEAQTFSAALDWKLPKKVYAGAEYLYRDIEREGVSIKNDITISFVELNDIFDFSSIIVGERERDREIRTYLYAVLSEQVVAAFDYIRSMQDAIDISEELDTDLASVALRYFSPQRWFGFLKGNYVEQDRLGLAGYVDGREDFWSFDAGVGYRFPDRHGAVQFIVNNVLDETSPFVDRGRGADIASELSGKIEFSVNF